MIEIYKTNIDNEREIAIVLDLLRVQYHHAKINFDLDDCDRILRIKGRNVCSLNVIKLLTENGFECSLLD
jgi:hypothetical protein